MFHSSRPAAQSSWHMCCGTDHSGPPLCPHSIPWDNWLCTPHLKSGTGNCTLLNSKKERQRCGTKLYDRYTLLDKNQYLAITHWNKSCHLSRCHNGQDSVYRCHHPEGRYSGNSWVCTDHSPGSGCLHMIGRQEVSQTSHKLFSFSKKPLKTPHSTHYLNIQG